jgi:hypothetical protein
MSLALTFRSYAADGRITDAEVRAGLRRAAKDTLTAPETKALRAQLSRYGDRFDADAKQRLSAFTAAASGPARTADPRVMNKDVGTTRYRPTAGSLSRNGLGARDVVQGATGDCYLLATLSAVARQKPGLLEDAITQKADGSWLVRFYGRDAAGQPVPVYIPVDRDLATRNGGLRYARSATKGELWVSLVEKAYAKWRGGFEQIGTGGAPSEAMKALTGGDAGWQQTSDSAPAAIYEQLRSTLAAKGLAVAATRTGPQDTNSGLVQRHAYTVLGVFEQGGERFVQLRNPWGRFEPGTRGGDGVFNLPLSKFLASFPDLFTGA